MSAQDSTSSAERVYHTLRKRILEGSLLPGQWLVEAEIAGSFQVSRTPVREALKRLVTEGLAAHDAFRGTIVRAVDPAEAAEIGEMREVHDGLAARLAARRASHDQLERLRTSQDRLQASLAQGRLAAAAKANSQFHELLYEAAGNRRLAQIARSLQDFVRRYTVAAIGDPQRATAIVNEHERILQALEARDSEAAEEAARAHGRACAFWSPGWAAHSDALTPAHTVAV
jgi:DNA-binding GntR family transcriptional regulator